MIGYSGPLSVKDSSSDLHQTAFLISQMLGELWTVCIVKVLSCSNAGGLAPAGTIEALPLVAMVDGQGQVMPHGTIHALPYLRLQGGLNAIIIDPQPGDLGLSVHASRDCSTAIATKAPAPPGSRRRFDPADGFYLGGVLGAAPTQYLRFSSAGIEAKTPLFTVTGTLAVTGSISAGGDIIAGAGAGHTVSLLGHMHTGVTTGSGNSGPPA